MGFFVRRIMLERYDLENKGDLGEAEKAQVSKLRSQFGKVRCAVLPSFCFRPFHSRRSSDRRGRWRAGACDGVV